MVVLKGNKTINTGRLTDEFESALHDKFIYRRTEDTDELFRIGELPKVLCIGIQYCIMSYVQLHEALLV